MNRIKQLRTEKSFSLRDLAKDFSTFLDQHGRKPITNVTISRWENEKSSPTAEMWGLLADYFGVSVDYLKGDCPVNMVNAKRVWLCRWRETRWLRNCRPSGSAWDSHLKRT